MAGLPRAVVLLSSGLDSTVNLYEAKTKCEVVLALTFDYGQRAASRETERARQIAKIVGVRHQIVELPWFRDFTTTSLIARNTDIPVNKQISIDDMSVSNETAKAVWVPNRNGILLNIAAGFAEGLGAKWIIPGFNIEEAATFPDNSAAFLQAATTALSYSTSNQIETVCFTTQMNKTQIVRRGRELGAPFELMWPCYFAGDKPCGECESCQRFTRAAKEA